MGYWLLVMGYGLWVMGYGLWVIGYWLWVIDYWLLIIGYGLWVIEKNGKIVYTWVKNSFLLDAKHFYTGFIIILST